MSTRNEVEDILKRFSGDFKLPKSLQERNLKKDRNELLFCLLTGTQDALRCCFRVSDDVQSGPIYCGELASYGIQGIQPLAFCEKHAPSKIQS